MFYFLQLAGFILLISHVLSCTIWDYFIFVSPVKNIKSIESKPGLIGFKGKNA